MSIWPTLKSKINIDKKTKSGFKNTLHLSIVNLADRVFFKSSYYTNCVSISKKNRNYIR